MKELLVEIQILQVILVKIQKEKRWRESICLRRVCMYLHTIILVEVWMQKTILMRSHRNEEQLTRNWRKDDPYYKAAKNFAELCSRVLRKV